MIGSIRVGPFTQTPEPFMGPVISDAAANHLLDSQRKLIGDGATPLVEMRAVGSRTAMLSPGLVDVTNAREHRADEELFGPLLQLQWVDEFDEAIEEANDTAYGLAAGLFTDDPELWRRFYRRSAPASSTGIARRPAAAAIFPLAAWA